MLTPYSPPGGGSEKYYLRYLLIGLAPEGKIGVWLEKPDKPNIRLTDKQILIETVSGEKMEMCNGRSAYKHGYSYPESTKTLSKIKISLWQLVVNQLHNLLKRNGKAFLWVNNHRHKS
ncbi:hypothetical protein ACVV4J_07935 [Escherichia coli]